MQLKIGKIPEFVQKNYGFDVSRQTVYNWINKGVRHEKLQTFTVPGHPTARYRRTMVTTAEMIADFFERASIPAPAV